EARDGLRWLIRVVRQELEGDALIEVLVQGGHDHPHAAAAEYLLDAVLAGDDLAYLYFAFHCPDPKHIQLPQRAKKIGPGAARSRGSVSRGLQLPMKCRLLADVACCSWGPAFVSPRLGVPPELRFVS